MAEIYELFQCQLLESGYSFRVMAAFVCEQPMVSKMAVLNEDVLDIQGTVHRSFKEATVSLRFSKPDRNKLPRLIHFGDDSYRQMSVAQERNLGWLKSTVFPSFC